MALFSELGVVEAALPIVLGKTVTNYGGGGGSPPAQDVAAADTIEFSVTQTAGIPIEETVSETIEFTTTAISSLQTPSAVDTLELDDAGRINETFEETVSETIEFTTVAISSLQTPTASDTIEILDFASEGLDQAGAQTGSVTENIEFSDTALKTKIIAAALTATASDTLELSAGATIPIERSLSDTIEFTDTAVSEHGKFIEETIVFTDTPVLNRVLNITVPETLQLTDFAVYETDDPNLCEYSPFVGSGGGNAPTPPPGTAPTIVPASTVTLFFPTTSPTNIVTIRVPEFGDRDRQLFERINRESRGGTLLIFADPAWPKLTRLAVTFTGLKETEAQEVIDFFQDTLGEEIGFTDWESRTWHGVVITPDEPLVRNHRIIRDVSFTVEVELQ